MALSDASVADIAIPQGSGVARYAKAASQEQQEALTELRAHPRPFVPTGTAAGSANPAGDAAAATEAATILIEGSGRDCIETVEDIGSDVVTAREEEEAAQATGKGKGKFKSKEKGDFKGKGKGAEKGKDKGTTPVARKARRDPGRGREARTARAKDGRTLCASIASSMDTLRATARSRHSRKDRDRRGRGARAGSHGHLRFGDTLQLTGVSPQSAAQTRPIGHYHR